AKEDGSYRIVGLPGPGLVGVYYQQHPYLRANEREDEFGTSEKSLRTAPYWLMFTSNYNALAKINPARGVDSVKRDVTLDPGRSTAVNALGRDDKPLAGVRNFGLVSNFHWDKERLKQGEGTAWFNPRRPQDVLFQHPEKGLIGVAQLPKDKGTSVT